MEWVIWWDRVFFDRYYGVVNGVVNVDVGEMLFEYVFLEVNGIIFGYFWWKYCGSL